MAEPSGAVVFLIGVGLAAVHAFAGKLRFLQVVPRSRFLSLTGGVSVAYVFVHLLPEITERQAELASEAGTLGPATEQALFVVAMAGFTVFYGLEQFATESRRKAQPRTDADASRSSRHVFWLHVGSFAVYNALIGYFLHHREEAGTVSLLLYAVAMALHFLVNDHSLRDHHEDAYTRLGRWVLVAGILLGVVLGVLVAVPEPFLDLLLAFLAGGVILNVIKEELPEERESSFWAFAVGLGSYSLLLLGL